jgi:hypothetical protein
VVGFALLVAVAGLAFAGGRLTAPSTAGTGTGVDAGTGGPGAGTFGNFTPPDGGQSGPGALGGSTVVSGTVTGVSDTSVTITLDSGTTVVIPIDSSTTFHTQAAGSPADVSPGDTVTVQVSRTAGGDGTTGTATDISVTAP